jgi:hypothetical protein
LSSDSDENCLLQQISLCIESISPTDGADAIDG